MAVDGLDGRIAFVTGGDSGIGAACVRAFARAGADVIANYLHDRDGAEQACEAARSHGRRAVALQGDVGCEEEVERMFDRTKEELGVPDILVNSAGLNMSDRPVAEMALDQWERVIRTDLTGSFLTSRRVVRELRAAGRPGAIINITSIHSTVMRAGGADYDAAKGGQRNLTRTLALEVAEDRITVNAIAPGMILTPMNEKAVEDPGYRDKLTRNIPMKRAGQPEEVAAVALFLASPAGAYMTGSTITIDGGLSLLLGQGA